MKFGKILVSIYQPGSAAILNSIPGLEVIEGLDSMQTENRLSRIARTGVKTASPTESESPVQNRSINL